MKQEIGKQCSDDNIVDKTGFKAKARMHQSKYRAEKLEVPYDGHGNYLTKADGEKGLNFYDGFGIFDSVKKYRKYNRQLYSNLLRSEHIPFNFFIPFKRNNEFCKKVINEILNDSIKTIDRIEIEFAPSPAVNYLNDRTSFDAYMEYTHKNNERGIIGIEVKYTEHEYPLKPNSKEETEINNLSSQYYIVTQNSKLYKDDVIEKLITDRFRQVWRNHVLGASILIFDKDKFKYFTSMTFYPEGNIHFKEVCKEYIDDLMKTNNNNFIPVTYENFFSICKKYCPDLEYESWLKYLNERYIV